MNIKKYSKKSAVFDAKFIYNSFYILKCITRIETQLINRFYNIKKTKKKN